MSQVPISCAACGWRLGVGSPGSAVQCFHCGCWVAAKAIYGNFEDALSGLAVVAVFALIGAIVMALLAVLLGRS